MVGKSYRVSVSTMFGERGGVLVGKFLGFIRTNVTTKCGVDEAWSPEDIMSMLSADKFLRVIDIGAALRFLPESVVPNKDDGDGECEIKVNKEYRVGWDKLFPSRW